MAKQYEVLARKWRPQQFDDVIGQQHVTSTLKNAIEQQRLAHAYLFVGSRGIGKTTIARVFAKALNCVHGPTPTPCDQCDPCKEIREGRSLDVLEIDGASNNGVEQVRDLRDNVRFAPTRGKYKVYIIDEVHMLSTAAFNALLKTLEEPPPHVKFIFATTEPQKVLATILSRCQRFDLRRIPARLIVDHLRTIAASEQVKIDDAALTAIARGAEGGLRDAESALDQLIAFCGDTITEADVLQVFGLVAHEKLAGLTDALIDGQTSVALGIVKELDEVGKDLQRIMADVLDHFRNLLVMSLGTEAAKLLEVPETELALLKAQAGRVDSDAVLRMIDALTNAESRLRYALSKRVFLEIAFVRAIKAKQMVGLEGILQKLNELKASTPASPTTASTGSAPVARPAAPASPAAPSGPVSLEEAWQAAVEHFGKVMPYAKSQLTSAKLIGIQGGIITVGFEPDFKAQRDFVAQARNLEVLQATLKEKLRRDVQVKFEITAAAAPSATAAARTASPAPVARTMEEFKNDPLIQKALEVFKGTIVEVRK